MISSPGLTAPRPGRPLVLQVSCVKEITTRAFYFLFLCLLDGVQVKHFPQCFQATVNLAPRNDWNGEERIPEPSSFKSTGFFRATYGSVFQEEREPRHLWDSAETDPLLPEHWEWEKAGLSGHIAYRRRISYTLGNNSAYAAPLSSKKKKKSFWKGKRAAQFK